MRLHRWPQSIWKKVRTWWQIPLQHQSTYTYLGGPESASIEIPPFRPFLWCKFQKIKNFKKFRIAPKFFFCFTIHKKLNRSCSLKFFFLFLKKKVVSLKKTSFEILWSEVWKGGFQLMLILGLLGSTLMLRWYLSSTPNFFSDGRIYW